MISETPELRRVFGLAAQLARPLARGWLPPAHANAVLLNAALAAARASGGDPLVLWRGAQHVLRLRVRNETLRRDLAAHAIDHVLQPLLASLRPSRVLLAEAHNVNGNAGFPLLEEEVNNITRTEIYWFLQRRRQSDAA